MTAFEPVAVVIVNYNSGPILAQCVQTVLASTLPVQIWVVDNASVDDSMAILTQRLQGDQQVNFRYNIDNIGFAKANNQVLTEIHTPYILFLNPDCFLQPDTLERFYQTMQDNPQAGMAGALVRNPDGSEQAGARRSVPSPWRSIVRVLHLDKLLPHHPKFQSFVLSRQPLPSEPIALEGISGACMFVRRQALEVVGPLDEGYFLHCEDLDWFMRFRQQGWEILFIPTIEVIHLKGVCSQRQPIRILWYKHRGMIRFYQKFFRHRYPLIIMGGVILAVWIRFFMLAIINLVKKSN